MDTMNTTLTQVTGSPKSLHLPIVGAPAIDIEAELAKFEQAERGRLGLLEGKEHWRDEVASTFTADQRSETTILVCGLTVAHDYLLEGALGGLGYTIKRLDVPDNNALRVGKEFGNRGQCNPTYFTVGNLVKYLVYLRDEKGMSKEKIQNDYLFLTAGACGPCRFGMYATEYRKALRDAGFDDFRVMLFQQQGGLKQATGEKQGLEMNPAFFIAIVKALLAGDVLNAIGYRLRPYEVVPGSTNEALERCKDMIFETLKAGRSIIPTMFNIRRELSKVQIDRTIVKPKVCIIGEFWAMTTEGDGNYGLQRFLEQEGAENDIQLVTAWILFMVWENVYDTKERMFLRGQDTGKKSIKDPAAAAGKLLKLKLADRAVRTIFQSMAWMMGLENYTLPNMDDLASEAKAYYNLNVRGGEAHMEVGKLVLTVKHKKATMVISVKPFGCMPSSGVSDGVQSIITEKHPEAIFLPIETNGDGAVNVYSRVQMMLFKARLAARKEVDEALTATGITIDDVRAVQAKLPWLGRSLHKPAHEATTSAGDFVYEAATWKKRLDRMAPVARFASAVAAAPKKLLELAASF